MPVKILEDYARRGQGLLDYSSDSLMVVVCAVEPAAGVLHLFSNFILA